MLANPTFGEMLYACNDDEIAQKTVVFPWGLAVYVVEASGRQVCCWLGARLLVTVPENKLGWVRLTFRFQLFAGGRARDMRASCVTKPMATHEDDFITIRQNKTYQFIVPGMGQNSAISISARKSGKGLLQYSGKCSGRTCPLLFDLLCDPFFLSMNRYLSGMQQDTSGMLRRVLEL